MRMNCSALNALRTAGRVSPRHGGAASTRAAQTLLVVACAGLGLLAGCASSNVGAAPAAQVIGVDDYDAFVTETVSLLRGYEWRMRTVDRAGGVIETQPATSAHFPEFWRTDAPGGFNYLESSLSTVRRIVTVRITPASMAEGVEPGSPALTFEDSNNAPTTAEAAASAPTEVVDSTAPSAKPYRVEVQVEKERYSAPERQVTTASGALALYSQSTPTIFGYMKSKPGDLQWISLGRDEMLEADLLRRILENSKHVE